MSYLVVGHHAVLGVEPGGVIEQDIPHEQAVQLVNGGFIAKVEEQEAPAAEQEAPAPAAETSEGS